MKNPALHAVPREQVNVLIAPKANTSIFDWLEANNRFLQSDDQSSGWSSEDEALLLDPILDNENNNEDEMSLAA